MKSIGLVTCAALAVTASAVHGGLNPGHGLLDAASGKH